MTFHWPWYNMIIVGVCIALYARTINYLLVVDCLTRYELMKNGEKCELKKAGLVRWLKYKLYGFGTLGCDFTNKETQQNTIRKDHVLTLTLHTIICCLIYEVLGHDDISFWAAILYAVNPINHQTAIWSNGRRYAINVILVLAMLALPKPWGLLAWVCTPFLHLTAVFAPVMLGWKYALAIPIASLIAWYWQFGDYKMRMGTQKSDEMLNWKPTRLIPSVKLFGFYFVRSFWPGKCMMVYPHLYAWGLTKQGNEDAHAFNLSFFRGVFSILVAMLGLFMLHGQELLYFIFIIASILQWCGWVMCTQHSCDRYTACATPFMMYLLSSFAFHLGTASLPIILFFAGLYISELNVVMPMYSNIIAFHRFHNYFYPNNIISRASMVHGMMGEKQPLSAWYEIVESLKYNPADMRMNLLAAEVCLCMGDKNSAQQHLNIAMSNCYEGQFDVQKPCFDDIQRRISGPIVYPNEAKPKNKYSPAKEDQKHRLAGLV